jgi:hypothetical protein
VGVENQVDDNTSSAIAWRCGSFTGSENMDIGASSLFNFGPGYERLNSKKN